MSSFSLYYNRWVWERMKGLRVGFRTVYWESVILKLKVQSFFPLHSDHSAYSASYIESDLLAYLLQWDCCSVPLWGKIRVRYALPREWKKTDLLEVFWSKFFDSSILNQILFFNDWMFLYSPIFSNSRTLSSVSRIIEIGKKTI